MDWRETVLEWEPPDQGVEPRVEVYQERGQDRQLLFIMGGACFPRLRALPRDHPDVIFDMLIQFHTMVARDDIPVEMAHRAMLKVDQYRERISPDAEGADPEGPPPVFWTISDERDEPDLGGLKRAH